MVPSEPGTIQCYRHFGRGHRSLVTYGRLVLWSKLSLSSCLPQKKPSLACTHVGYSCVSHFLEAKAGQLSCVFTRFLYFAVKADRVL